MSALVNVSTFKSNEKLKIIDELSIKSKDNYIMGLNGKKELAPKIIINCFKLNDNKDYVHIPFSYMCNYRNKIYNLNKNHYFLNNFVKFNSTPRDYQIDVIEESLNKLKLKHCISLDLPTSFGKTFTSLFIGVQLNYRICILVTNTTIRDSWIGEIKKRINSDVRLYVTGEKKYRNVNDPQIIISLITSIHKIPKEWKDGVGTLIIDECHLFNTQQRIYNVLEFTPRYIIGLSATQELDSGLDRCIKLVFGEDKVKREMTKKYDAFIIKTNIHYKSFDYNEYLDEQIKCEERVKLIEKIIRHNQEHKIIVMSKRVEMCNNIGESIKENHSKLYGNMNNYDDSRVLLVTFSKAGTGFDESNFCDNLEKPSNLGIITFTNNTFVPFTQAKGRVMRSDNPIVVYFLDENNISRKHIRMMRKWIEESNGSIYEVDYNSSDYENDDFTLNFNTIKELYKTHNII